jgi:aerobic carbon-monoxide dehydrogenase medium subunit
MKTPRFEYHAPRTVDEVVGLLGEHGDEAKVLAGGQSLVPLLAMRLARPGHLVDINDVDGLSGISTLNGTVVFGSTTRERQAESSPVVRERLPVLAAALPQIGHVSIRNRGTVGGSIAHADASAELPAVATITGAEMVVRSARGQRIIPAEQFFQGHFTTALADDELLVEVRMPQGPPGAGWAFEEVARRHGDFALVGVAAMVALDTSGRIDAARLCLIGVADRPLRASTAEASLAGGEPTADVFTAAAEEAAKDLRPASDMHGSSEYRQHLARVTVRRALQAAASAAGGGE